MKLFQELASTRRSIRKYESTPIPPEDVRAFIEAAVTAPSGCNSQCWHFVAVANKAVIAELANAVREATRTFYGIREDEEFKAYLERKCRAATFFENAPLVIAVFMTKLDYYDPKIVEIMQAKGYDHVSMMRRMSDPDVLSIGAAVQNLLLCIHEKGYGACWMNEPAVARERIGEILHVPAEECLMSLIPVGVPAYRPRTKKMKPLNEVFRYIP